MSSLNLSDDESTEQCWIKPSSWVWSLEFLADILVGPQFSFGRRTWVRKCLKFSFYRYGPVFGLFLAKQVQSLGFLEGFEWVQISVFSGRTWVRVSLKFNLSSSKQFKFHYAIWVCSNTIQTIECTFLWIQTVYCLHALCTYPINHCTYVLGILMCERVSSGMDFVMR